MSSELQDPKVCLVDAVLCQDRVGIRRSINSKMMISINSSGVCFPVISQVMDLWQSDTRCIPWLSIKLGKKALIGYEQRHRWDGTLLQLKKEEKKIALLGFYGAKLLCGFECLPSVGSFAAPVSRCIQPECACFSLAVLWRLSPYANPPIYFPKNQATSLSSWKSTAWTFTLDTVTHSLPFDNWVVFTKKDPSKCGMQEHNYWKWSY